MTIKDLQTQVGLLQQILNFMHQLIQTRNTQVYNEAVKWLGADASPSDLADDVVGCAESVTTILARLNAMPVILGTSSLLSYASTSGKFRRVASPVAGNIVIYATGTGNGSILGHTGIVGKNNIVMTNDSYTGKWSANYTVDSMFKRYNGIGGMHPHYFEVI